MAKVFFFKQRAPKRRNGELCVCVFVSERKQIKCNQDGITFQFTVTCTVLGRTKRGASAPAQRCDKNTNGTTQESFLATCVEHHPESRIHKFDLNFQSFLMSFTSSFSSTHTPNALTNHIRRRSASVHFMSHALYARRWPVHGMPGQSIL